MPSIETTEDFLNGIRQRDDLLSSAAQSYISKSENESSTLILEIISVDELRRINLLSAVVLLSAQTKFLPENIWNAYFQTAKTILSVLTEDMIRVLFKELPSITRTLTNIACHAENTKSILPLIRHIAENIYSSPHSLSPVHVDVLQLAIKGTFYSTALQFIEAQDILEVKNKQDISPEHVLRYFYYVGICYIAVKNYRRALAHFTTVLCAPAIAFSQIMEESLKKCKLLSLIAHGKVFEVPKQVSLVVHRMVTNDAQRSTSSSSSSSAALPATTTSSGTSSKLPVAEYDQLARVYTTSTSQYNDVRGCVDSAQVVFERDLNLGLALQVVAAWQRKRLHELAETFVTLSIAEVTAVVGTSSEVETNRLIMTTVEEENLIAHIDHTQELVIFTELPSASDGMTDTSLHHHNQFLMQQLEISMQSLVSLHQRFRVAHSEALVSEDYIMKTTTNATSGTSGGARSSIAASDIMDF